MIGHGERRRIYIEINFARYVRKFSALAKLRLEFIYSLFPFVYAFSRGKHARSNICRILEYWE